MTSSFALPNPFPVSGNLCQFQKGSGVTTADVSGCERPGCVDPGVAADELQSLFPSLDDETVWTAQAAIVSACDECIYGPVDATLREFIGNLYSVCCLDQSCLVGIIRSILCNPILNYRARFIDAQNAIAQVQSQNAELVRSFNAAQATAAATNANICSIVNAVKTAIAQIPQGRRPGLADSLLPGGLPEQPLLADGWLSHLTHAPPPALPLPAYLVRRPG